MNRFCFLLFALLCAFSAVAQHTYTLTFDEPVTTLQSYYNNVRIIDVRAGKDNLGYVKTGAFNKSTDVVTSQPLDKTLEAYYARMLSKGTRELVVVLYDLTIADRVGGAEMGTIYFNADFFSKGSGGYQFLGKTDSIFEVSASMDVTKKLLEAAHNVIRDKILQYTISEKHPVSSVLLTEHEMKERRKTIRLSYPIYRTDSFRRGIYLSVDSFLNNQVIDTPFSKILLSSGDRPKFSYAYTKANGKKGERVDPDSYFSIYDGKQWVLSDDPRLLVMHWKDGELYVTKTFSGLANNRGTMMMFGLVGALVTSGASGTGVYEARFDPEIKDFRPVKRLQ